MQLAAAGQEAAADDLSCASWPLTGRPSSRARRWARPGPTCASATSGPCAASPPPPPSPSPSPSPPSPSKPSLAVPSPPQQTPEASLAPGCAARPLMLDYCWPVAVSITPRAREVHSLPSHTSTTSALITLRLVSHSLHLCAPLPAPSPPQ